MSDDYPLLINVAPVITVIKITSAHTSTAVGAFLLIRTIVAPPVVIVGRTTDDLKAFLCKTDWWDHTFTSSTYTVQNLNGIIGWAAKSDGVA